MVISTSDIFEIAGIFFVVLGCGLSVLLAVLVTFFFLAKKDFVIALVVSFFLACTGCFLWLVSYSETLLEKDLTKGRLEQYKMEQSLDVIKQKINELDVVQRELGEEERIEYRALHNLHSEIKEKLHKTELTVIRLENRKTRKYMKKMKKQQLYYED